MPIETFQSDVFRCIILSDQPKGFQFNVTYEPGVEEYLSLFSLSLPEGSFNWLIIS